MATPGTVVVAAPDEARTAMIFSDRDSVRSMARVRSGSLPGGKPSPLSRASSFDDFYFATTGARKTGGLRSFVSLEAGSSPRESTVDEEDEDRRDNDDSDSGKEMRDDDEEWRGRHADEGGRKMTPPIPDWVLGAGKRSSMAEYKKRKGEGTRQSHLGDEI